MEALKIIGLLILLLSFPLLLLGALLFNAPEFAINAVQGRKYREVDRRGEI